MAIDIVVAKERKFGVRLDYCFCPDWIFSQNSFFRIFRERKEEIATETNIPNIKRRISLSFNTVTFVSRIPT
jgi:hypothetical protein